MILLRAARSVHLGQMSRALLLFTLLVTTQAGAAYDPARDLDGSFIELSTWERGVIEYHLEKGLRDPRSLQFRNIKSYRIVATNVTIICGEANAKNGYGGYIGFEPFAIRVYPDNKTDTFFPLAWDANFRPDIRAAVKRTGC